MNTSELILYYANLLILQYLGKPNAYATIQVLVAPAIMDQLPLQVQNAFTIGTATGVQLDIIGKYVGVSRNANGFNGPISLNDSDFTKLIQLKIIQNNAGSSLATIVGFLNTYFPRELFIFDNNDMSISYLMIATLGNQQLAQVFVKEGLLPKPMGVELASLTYIPTLELFGMPSYDTPFLPNIWPFNTYDAYNTGYTWLSYSDSVVI